MLDLQGHFKNKKQYYKPYITCCFDCFDITCTSVKLFLITHLAEAPRTATFRSALKFSSIAEALADAPFNDGLNCLIISAKWNKNNKRLVHYLSLVNKWNVQCADRWVLGLTTQANRPIPLESQSWNKMTAFLLWISVFQNGI